MRMEACLQKKKEILGRQGLSLAYMLSKKNWDWRFSVPFSRENSWNKLSHYGIEEYITYNIVHDIETINEAGQYQYLTINGQMPYSREFSMLREKYPLFKTLIPVYITNSAYLGGAQLQHYMQYLPEFISIDENEASTIRSTAPILSNSIYSCYVDQNRIIIHFNETVQ